MNQPFAFTLITLLILVTITFDSLPIHFVLVLPNLAECLGFVILGMTIGVFWAVAKVFFLVTQWILGAFWGVCLGLTRKLTGRGSFRRHAKAPSREKHGPTHCPGGSAEPLPPNQASRPEPTGGVGAEGSEKPRGTGNSMC